MHDDVGVIETNHVAQDGRRTNNYVPTNKSGDSSYAGAGSTRGCFGVQSENQKKIANEPEKENRRQSDRKAQFILHNHSTGCVR